MTQNNINNPDRATFPAATPGPISWWLNPSTNEHDPFLTLYVGDDGRLPTFVEEALDGGLVLRYEMPLVQHQDYALMPEVVQAQQVQAFCDELNAALDEVDNRPPVWLAAMLLLAAAFWTAVWLVWRGWA